MEVAALLTGRGNNTLKDKNILDVLGKPVLYYPANAAKMSKLVDSYFCSSDDEKILNMAAELGYEKIVRPKELSSPNAQHIDCILHGLKEIRNRGIFPDILIVLLANNVTVKTSWIDECIRMIRDNSQLTSVIPVYEDNDHHPYRAKKIDNNGYLSMWIEGEEEISTNRQDLPQCLFPAHNFWVLRTNYLDTNMHDGQKPWKFFGNKILPYIINESIDIHKEEDLYLASEWVKNNE